MATGVHPRNLASSIMGAGVISQSVPRRRGSTATLVKFHEASEASSAAGLGLELLLASVAQVRPFKHTPSHRLHLCSLAGVGRKSDSTHLIAISLLSYLFCYPSDLVGCRRLPGPEANYPAVPGQTTVYVTEPGNAPSVQNGLCL